MNVTEERIDDLTALLTVKIKPEDYLPKVESGLKDAQKKVNMPGFRAGKAPMGMVRKAYGGRLLMDEIQNKLDSSIENYLKENKRDTMGNPIPHGDRNNVWEIGNDFEFTYEIGYAPDFEINLEDGQVYDYPKVILEDKMVDDEIKHFLVRYGKTTNPETSEEKDVLYGKIEELDNEGNVAEDGINKDVSIAIQNIKDEELKKSFIGVSKDSVLVFDPHKLGDNKYIADLLDKNEEEASAISSNFKYTVSSINRNVPAEMNQEFFHTVYGDLVNTPEEFREKFVSQIHESIKHDTDKVFANWAIKKIIDKANVSLPETYLRKMIELYNEKGSKIDESEFPAYFRQTKATIVTRKLFKQYGVTMTNEEIEHYVEDMTRYQFRNFGTEMEDDKMEEFVKYYSQQTLKDEKQMEKIKESIFEMKLTHLLKEKLKINYIDVTYNDLFKQQ